jgi:endonuclease YncB( thermonuclease family)
MRESDRRRIVRHLGAVALAGSLALGLAIISPPDLSKAAAPDMPSLSISGRAHVIDGDTLVIDGTRVRLEGIDAPESAQRCQTPTGNGWNCGSAAAQALRDLTAHKEVRCEGSEHDTYGRLIAICRVGALELNKELVRRGLAWAFVRYSQRLTSAEAEARRLKIGIWQGENQPAWDYRADRWSQAQAQASAPEGCVIKGNISRNGRIYHMPWSPYYDSVQINPSRGERWFCSAAEALAAGWRPAYTN